MKKLLALIIVSWSLHAVDFYEGEPSGNFIIRWAFQELCDHCFDFRTVWPTPGNHNFDSAKVQAGDMIFVRDIKAFFRDKHPKITVPYFILTSGEYLDKVKKKHFKYVEDEKVLAWFTIHPCEEPHEKIVPLPLGIVQYEHLYDKRKKVHRQLMDFRNTPKKKLVYMNFTDWNMPFRTKIMNYFKKKSFVTYRERCRFKEYISELAKHKFVISPPGLGPDCYRVWESCLVGTIPIVKHSHMDSMYEGLPILFIDDWKEVTEEFLIEKYEEMTAVTYSQEKLYMEYWIAIIEQTRKKLWPPK